MNTPWQVFDVNEKLKTNLNSKLAKKNQIFSFDSDPLLSSLCACLGLQHEIGQKDLDRLSFPLGVDLEKHDSNPWRTEVITLDGEFALRAWLPGLKEITPTHPDFMRILHPLSLDENETLYQVVIFPMQVFYQFAEMGFELVTVRDWALSSFLSLKEQSEVNYLLTNNWEVESNTALIQAELLVQRQIAFLGTHDIADHLLGGNKEIFDEKRQLYLDVQEKFKNTFSKHKTARNIELIVSYTIGVILDDMAQPRWYRSTRHESLSRKLLQLLDEVGSSQKDIKAINLPESFHKLIFFLRRNDCSLHSMEKHFLTFAHDLKLQMAV